MQYLIYYRAIHTYNDKGTTATRARAQDHLVIYSGDKLPHLVKGESKVVLGKLLIRITLGSDATPLRPASRITSHSSILWSILFLLLELGKLIQAMFAEYCTILLKI